MYYENNCKPERALLVALELAGEDSHPLLDELAELAKTAGAEIVATVTQKRESPNTATYVGSGRLEEIKEFCRHNEVDLIIVDGELTPTQQRNLEKETDIRVIDRTLLILDIFSSRAQSMEGRLQVELAQYRYLLPRLAGKGISLSRQGGGQGGIGARRGAGETKLETDRRHIRRRIHALEEQLALVEERRERTRRQRRKSGFLSVALVGYTNAGKSTLMNRLTEAGVLAEDKLFATLDPTARALKLPDGRTVMLIDTVGLIRKLPHHLVRAFRSTLVEAAEADLIVNVCDASSEEAQEHLRVTLDLLQELGCADRPILSVFNKCDLADPSTLPLAGNGTIYLSALHGDGVDRLLEAMAKALPPTRRRVVLLLPFEQGARASRVRKEGTVHSEEYLEQGLRMDCTIDCQLCTELACYIQPQ